MRAASYNVKSSVNDEISRRIRSHYPNGGKLRHQSPGEWIPNAAFVNCYDGCKESVGYHSDQLTYLGPRAIIGSLSLGVAREFRVRKILPKHNIGKAPKGLSSQNIEQANEPGSISIHLPHNSLLVMHAEMQEEWQHSIHPARVIDTHPVSGNKRINTTYRHYRDAFHPRLVKMPSCGPASAEKRSLLPRCKCDVPTVLKCVQRQVENLGRYMWTCDVNRTPGQTG